MCSSFYANLYTKEGKSLADIPHNSYPRPALKRDSFFCLNGKWRFEVSVGKNIPENFKRDIIVPFSPESLLSGIHEVFSEDSYLFYKKTFSFPEGFIKDRVLLHFGAVDQIAEVFFNGAFLGEHIGGYEPFCFDVTEHILKENVIVVRVRDNLSQHILPYGKQRRKRGGMWYTPTSGIWQTVWMESTPKTYVRSLDIKTGENFAEITAQGIENQNASITVFTPKGEIKKELNGGKVKIELDDVKVWSPEDPYLYRFEISTDSDKIESYFAIRTLEVKTVNGKARLCLNGKPYFFHGLLDQGYFSDGLLTPADEKGFERDILSMKSLGFNMLRKHIKIEPQQFYYDCDRLGMVVFQDMVNNGHYCFLRDTALPTVGFKSLGDKHFHKNKESRERFELDMKKTVELLKNHPCICYWTIFNEGWGQFCADSMYDKLKALDGTRFIDSTSGWFWQKKSDVKSEHIYFKPYKFAPADIPTVLSEFGGYSYRPEGHIFNLKKAYGYKFFEDREEFEKALLELYRKEVIPAARDGLSAAVYTQVSDVEDETNGLLSYDREVLKVDADKMQKIAEELKDAVKGE